MTGMQAEAEKSAELNRGAQLGQHNCLQGCVCVCEFSRGLTQKMGATERQGRTFRARWRGSSTIIATVQKKPLLGKKIQPSLWNSIEKTEKKETNSCECLQQSFQKIMLDLEDGLKLLLDVCRADISMPWHGADITVHVNLSVTGLHVVNMGAFNVDLLLDIIQASVMLLLVFHENLEVYKYTKHVFFI